MCLLVPSEYLFPSLHFPILIQQKTWEICGLIASLLLIIITAAFSSEDYAQMDDFIVWMASLREIDVLFSCFMLQVIRQKGNSFNIWIMLKISSSLIFLSNGALAPIPCQLEGATLRSHYSNNAIITTGWHTISRVPLLCVILSVQNILNRIQDFYYGWM